MTRTPLEEVTRDRDYWRSAYRTLRESTGRDINDGLGLDPRRTPPVALPAHPYEPHGMYPWFCRHCGYPEAETLKHGGRRRAA